MRNVLTMANRVEIIISEMVHWVYHIYTVLKLSGIKVCFAHLVFSKFVLR